MVGIVESLKNRVGNTTVYYSSCGRGTTNAEKARIAAVQGNVVKGVLSDPGTRAHEELTHALDDKGKTGEFSVRRNILGKPIGLVYKTVGPRTPEERFNIFTAGVGKGYYSGRDIKSAALCVELDPSLNERFDMVFDVVARHVREERDS